MLHLRLPRSHATFFKDPDLSPVSLQRVGGPAEFGLMAEILLSLVSSYVAGAAIAIDGGQVKML